MYLVLNNLQAKAQPGVVYDVYLNLPPGAPANTRNNFQVGTINFFDAIGHADHAAAKPRFRSFDVTSFVKTHPTGPAANLVASIIPRGASASGAGTVIGEVSLV
jgi:hypothetical protein